MKNDEEINLDIEMYCIFEPINKELEYVANSLEFLNQSLMKKFEDLEEGFNNDANSIYLDDYKSDFTDNYHNTKLPTQMIEEDLRYLQEEAYLTHDTISGYIIQSILVKQVSVIEKFLKSLYKYTLNKNGIDELSNVQLSFLEKIKNYICNLLQVKIKEEKQFSDIKKTVKAISKITNINFNKLDINNWCQLRIMNELRNKFAHGSDEFYISKDILKDLKTEFGNNFIIEIQNKENIYLCKIENNLEPLIIFNKNMRNYMKQLEDEFKKYCKNL